MYVFNFKIRKKSAELAFKSAWMNMESFGSGGALQRVVVVRGGDVVALGDDVVALSGAAIALSDCVAVVRRAYIDLEMESLS